MEATVFSNKNIGKLRAMIVDNEPYFVADDINAILSTDLEYDSIMYNDIDSEDRIEVDIDDEPLEMLNVSGVYALTSLWRCSTYRACTHLFITVMQVMRILQHSKSGLQPMFCQK